MRVPMMSLILFLLLPGLASGFGYFDAINNGTPLPGLSPLSIAMGSSRAIGPNEPLSIFTNPSQLSALPLSLQLSASTISWKERVIESDYDNILRTYNTFDNPSFAATASLKGLSLGVGFAKVAEFGYEGTHIVYDEPDEPEVAVAVLYSEGAQYEGMFGLAGDLTESLSIGFSGGVRTAGADYEYYYNSHIEEIPDSSSQWSMESTEFAWHAGLSLGGHLFKAGLSYGSETDYMEDVIAFGASALAEHLNNITVGFEAELTSPFDGNRFLGKLSVIMPLRHNLNALTSVSFDDQRVANRAGLGFGIGFDWTLNRLQINGGLLSRFRARRDTAFPEETSYRIDDGFAVFSLGVTYRP